MEHPVFYVILTIEKASVGSEYHQIHILLLPSFHSEGEVESM